MGEHLAPQNLHERAATTEKCNEKSAGFANSAEVDEFRDAAPRVHERALLGVGIVVAYGAARNAKTPY